ncbi:hypothetical protein HHI36_010676, partial [Cryptolaemus montrouzieri]
MLKVPEARKSSEEGVDDSRLTRSDGRKATALEQGEPGPDNIHAKILKFMYTISDQFLQTLTVLFNNIYNKGEDPKDWLCSTFITIPNNTTTPTST